MLNSSYTWSLHYTDLNWKSVDSESDHNNAATRGLGLGRSGLDYVTSL